MDQVDCWRERVSNATELNQLIQDYPLLLSYSLDTSVSRLDFLIEVSIDLCRWCTAVDDTHAMSNPSTAVRFRLQDLVDILLCS